MSTNRKTPLSTNRKGLFFTPFNCIGDRRVGEDWYGQAFVIANDWYCSSTTGNRRTSTPPPPPSHLPPSPFPTHPFHISFPSPLPYVFVLFMWHVRHIFIFYVLYNQFCFICHPPVYNVSEHAGIEPRTVANLAIAVRYKHSARAHPQLG
jgi:hypothetical protein